jgi:ribosomal protein L40E
MPEATQGRADEENLLYQGIPLRPSSQIIRPLTPLNLLRIPVYRVEVVQSTVDSANRKNIEQVEVHPIESIAHLVFWDKKKNNVFQIPIVSIIETIVVSEKIGKIRKKEDLMVQITFKGDDDQENSIKVDLEDKYIDSFMEDIETVRRNTYDTKYWHYGQLTLPTDGNEPKVVDFYPAAPFLSEGEEVIWSYISTEGILNKKAVWMNVLTNYRALQYFYKERTANYMLITAIDDVLVTNKSRTSNTASIGSYSRSRYHLGGVGNAKTTSTTVGDVDLYANGRLYIKFSQIGDPHGLAAVVKSIRKQQGKMIFTKPAQPETEVIEPEIDAEPEVHIAENTTSAEKDLSANNIPSVANAKTVCVQCRHINPDGSKFCNECGSQLSSLCSKCGSSNPPDAKFCNQCGSKIIV